MKIKFSKQNNNGREYLKHHIPNQVMSFLMTLWLMIKLGFITIAINQSNSQCNSDIHIPLKPRNSKLQ